LANNTACAPESINRMRNSVAVYRRPLNNVQARCMLTSVLDYRELSMPTNYRAMRVGVIVTSLLAPFALAAQSTSQSITELTWLSGCWASETAEAGSIESWLSPAGGTLLGVSRTVKGGKTVAYEFMQIRALDNGTLAFIAKPSNQSEATFPLLRAAKHEVIFENKAHDFPQRVSYRLVAAGALLARIEGTRNGQERAIDYPMKRIACPGESK
jgi:Domain of unknown function (DUF6265)